MHLTDRDLGEALEVPTQSELVRTHIARCPACRDTLDRTRETERRIATQLRSLDHPSRHVTFAMIEARAADSPTRLDRGDGPARLLSRASSGRQSDLSARRTGRDVRGSAFRWGALGLLLAASAAAAAIPTSPVRRLIASLVGHRVGPVTLPSAAQRSPVAQDRIASSAPRGLAIVPHDGRVVLAWRVPQPRSVVRIKPIATGVSTAARISVLASGDGAIYAVSRDTIAIDNRAAPNVNFEVELPTASELPVVTLLVDGRVVFSRRGATVETRGVRGGDGGYSIALATQSEP